MQHLKKSAYLLPLAILILNLALKFFFINLMPVGHDEPHTIGNASLGSVGQIITSAFDTNNPPLFEIMLHFWIKLFGDSLASLRALPVIFSSLTAVVIYKMGKGFFSKNVGVLTALLFTFSTLHIHHSHNIRVYALYILLSCISMYAFFHCTKKPSSKKHLAILAITNGIAFYVHFFTFFVVLMQGVSALFFKKLRISLLKNYILSALGTLLLFAPYIPIVLTRTPDAAEETYVATLASPQLGGLYMMLNKFSNAPLVTLLFISILIVSGGLFLYRSYRRKGLELPLEWKVILLWFPGIYLFMFIFSQFLNIFIARYVILASIGFYFVVSIALDELMKEKPIKERRVKYLLPIGAITLMILTCQPNTDWYSKRGDPKTLIQHLFTSRSSTKGSVPGHFTSPYSRTPLLRARFPQGPPPPSSSPVRAGLSPFERSVLHPAPERKHSTGSQGAL